MQRLPPHLYLLFKRASPFSRPPRLPEGGSSVQAWAPWCEVTGRPFPTLLLLQLSLHWAGLCLKFSEGPAGTPPPAASTLLTFREHSLGSWRHQQGLSKGSRDTVRSVFFEGRRGFSAAAKKEESRWAGLIGSSSYHDHCPGWSSHPLAHFASPMNGVSPVS